MWILIFIFILILINHDYSKQPIDNLYFYNFWRPLIGIKNSLYDLFLFKKKYNVKDFGDLFLLKKCEKLILQEFNSLENKVSGKGLNFYDPFESEKENYKLFNTKDFPFTHSLIKMIGNIDYDSSFFYVADGPVELKPHKGDENSLLRYNLVLKGSKNAILTTEFGEYPNNTGNEILFDHSRFHTFKKTDEGKRISLIVNVYRF
jgi:hypothetical protein